MHEADQKDWRRGLHQWHAEAGLTPSRLAGPAQSPLGVMAIVVDGRGAEMSKTCLTVSSLLRGSVQRSRIQVLLTQSSDASSIAEWLAHEPQISLIGSLSEVTPGEEFLMVVPAGVIVGTYSVEAAVACLETTSASVLRVLVDGVDRAVELWRSEALGGAAERSHAEGRARLAGGERWVSGASTGMHAAGRPAPKMFLRKGPAEKFEMHMVVRDIAKPDVKHDYEMRLRELEAQLARAKRSAANGTGESGGARIFRVVKKGPRYVSHRAVALIRQRSKGRN